MGQKIFAYKPKIEVYIASYKKQEMIDISPDITDAQIYRKLNEPSTVTVTVSNDFKKYDGVFEPMDRIIIYLTRVERMLVFSGYLDSAPYKSLYPGSAQITASCTLKRLKHTYWDPGLQSSIDLYMRHGIGGGAPSAAVAEAVRLDPEGGIGWLLVDMLSQVGGWVDDNIYVMPFPSDFIETFTNQIVSAEKKRVEAAAKKDEAVFQEFVKKLLSVGGAGASVAWNPTGGVAQWLPLILKYAAKYGVRPVCIAAMIEIESGGNPVNPNNWDTNAAAGTPSDGLLQFIWPTMQGAAAEGNIDLHGKTGTAALQDPELSIEVGCYWFSQKLKDYGGSEVLAVAGAWSPLTAAKLIATIAMMEAEGTVSQAASAAPTTVSDYGPDADAAIASGGTKIANNFVDAALKFEGQAYVWGGGHPGQKKVMGVDCSGLINCAYIMAGLGDSKSLDVVGWEAECNNGGQIIAPSATLDAGTLLINSGEHIGISLGGGKSIEAMDEANGVKVTNLDPGRWQKAGIHPAIGTSKIPGQPGAGAGANSQKNEMLNVAFNTLYLLPQIGTDASSYFYTGDKAILNDVPLMSEIVKLCKGSLRSFCSAPDGSFVAFFPDYFNVTWKKPYFILEDIEIKDLTINRSDSGLATHVFVAGDISKGGTMTEIDRWLATVGVVSVEHEALMSQLINKNFGDGDFNSKEFLRRFGARPFKETSPALSDKVFEYFYALNQFMYYWSKQFSSTLSITFMPELFPGARVGFGGEHDLTVYVEGVTHSCSYSTGFSTSVTVTAPASMGGDNEGMVLSQDSPHALERNNTGS